MTDDRVKILVARRVGATAIVRLADAARAVDECLVEAAFVRLIRFLVAEVPFAKDAAGIVGLLKYLRQRGGLERHALALEDRMRHAVLHWVPSGHQCRPRRRARRAHNEAREAGARVVQLVQVRGANPGMPMSADRAVTLVIGDHKDDVRFLRLGVGQSTQGTEEHGE